MSLQDGGTALLSQVVDMRTISETQVCLEAEGKTGPISAMHPLNFQRPLQSCCPDMYLKPASAWEALYRGLEDAYAHAWLQ